MNPGIFYLYEYKNNQKLRNAGFLKIVQHYDSCTIQISARHLPVNRQNTLPVLAFHMENEEALTNLLGKIPCQIRSISARLEVPATLFSRQEFEKADGLFIQLPGETLLAALLPGVMPDTRKIKSADDIQNNPPAAPDDTQIVPSAAPDDTQIVPPAAPDDTQIDPPAAPDDTQINPPAVPDDTQIVPPAAPDDTQIVPPAAPDDTQIDPPAAPDDTQIVPPAAPDDTQIVPPAAPDDTQIVPPAAPDEPLQESSGDSLVLQAEWLLPNEPLPESSSISQEANFDDSVHDDTPCEDENNSCTEHASDSHPHDDTSCQDENNSCTEHASDSHPHDDTPCEDENNSCENDPCGENTCAPSVRKIERCDLAVLPRRFWNLANNSFLLHGYHNYNHLLLVEEDGHHWLGVPGIYEPREAKAAEIFGFPQFTRSYNEQVPLSNEERDNYGDFGYWFRYIE